MISLGPLPALQERGFRSLWRAQAISLTGTAMHNAAVLWHVSLLAPPGQKAVALGAVGLVRAAPMVVFALVGGLAADRFDRRKLMLAAQSSLAVLAALMALASLDGNVSLGWIYAFTAMASMAAAFDATARSSLVPLLVPRALLPNAVALNTTLFQLASMIGPATAGIALIWVAPGWLYAANALSFLPVIAALSGLRPVERQAATVASRGVRSLLEGLQFVFRDPLVRGSVLLDFLASLFSSAATLLPLVATEVLNVGSVGYGCLAAAPSFGAVGAGIGLLRMENAIERRGRLLLWAVTGYGAATVLFGVATSYPLAVVALAMTGACDTVNMVLRNVIKQLATPDGLRGRMNGVQLLFAQTGPQLGEVEAGFVAQAAGAPFSIVSGGIGCLLAAGCIAWFTPELRRCTVTTMRSRAQALAA